MSGQGKRTIDLGQAGRVKVPDDDEGLSPAKVRKGSDGGATMGSGITAAELQALLAQQTEQLMRSQHAAVESAVTRFEKIVDDKLEGTANRVDGLEAKLESLQKRLDELGGQAGGGGPETTAGDDTARRQRTLVFGGWNRDTRRADLLDELKHGLESLGVSRAMDDPPLPRGPGGAWLWHHSMRGRGRALPA